MGPDAHIKKQELLYSTYPVRSMLYMYRHTVTVNGLHRVVAEWSDWRRVQRTSTLLDLL